MAAAPDDTLGRLSSQLARRWVNQRLAAVQSYGRILSDYGRGATSASDALTASAKLALEEAVRYPADALGLATDYVAALARRANLEVGAASAKSKSAGAEVHDLDLSGPIGGEAVGAVSLANKYADPLVLSFSASRFIGPDGEIAAVPVIAPVELTLDPGQESEISVKAALKARTFKPGATYVAHVAVLGLDNLVLRVRLTTLAPK